MVAKRFDLTVLLLVSVLLVSGCAVHRKREPTTPSEVVWGVAEAMVNVFCPDDSDPYRTENLKRLEKRRQWQRENLSEAELRKLKLF